MIQALELDRLQPAADNPREVPGELEDLVASIRIHGILQPLLVTPLGVARYTIVCGERRWRAARRAGLTEVPATVRTGLTDAQRLELMVVENVQRASLDPIEEGKAFRRLIDTFGYTQREVSEKTGKSQSYVSRRLQLLELPKSVQREVREKTLPVGVALGYDYPADPERVFEDDDRLQMAWRELRQQVIQTRDRQLLTAMADFIGAFQRWRRSATAAGVIKRRAS